jgi:hypothetical protein
MGARLTHILDYCCVQRLALLPDVRVRIVLRKWYKLVLLAAGTFGANVRVRHEHTSVLQWIMAHNLRRFCHASLLSMSIFTLVLASVGHKLRPLVRMVW